MSLRYFVFSGAHHCDCDPMYSGFIEPRVGTSYMGHDYVPSIYTPRGEMGGVISGILRYIMTLLFIIWTTELNTGNGKGGMRVWGMCHHPVVTAGVLACVAAQGGRGEGRELCHKHYPLGSTLWTWEKNRTTLHEAGITPSQTHRCSKPFHSFGEL